MRGRKPLANLWDRVQCGSLDECWAWIGTKNNSGAGVFTENGRLVYAHRRAYELSRGPVPEGMWIVRDCETSSCCNPAHLRLLPAGKKSLSAIQKQTSQRRQEADENLENRFWSKVARTSNPGDCWEWKASRYEKGYGFFRRRGHVKGRSGDCAQAHRMAWELTNGLIPDGLCVCHRCDNPPCCNPSHLFLGTNDDNMADMCAKDRHARLCGEKSGRAKLTWEKVREIRRLYSEGGVTQQQLADLFGVNQRSISLIVLGKSWREP